MSAVQVSRLERVLAGQAAELRARAPRFDPAALPGDLPGAVGAWLERSLVAGEPALRLARLGLRGEIRLGRWLPFRAVELLDPHRGFCWRARVGWGPFRIDGMESYVGREGTTDWRAYGLVPVARLAGGDVTRSNRGRCRAEAVFVPGSLHPGWGVSFRDVGVGEIEARWDLDGDDAPVRLGIDPDGLLRRAALRRRGAPGGGASAGDWFIVELDGHRRLGGVLVPGRWEMSWSDRPDGAGDVVLRGTVVGVEWPG